MDIRIPGSSRKTVHFPRWGLALFSVIGAIGIVWMWMRYQAIKDLPQVKAQIERIKEIWNDKINVHGRKIQPEFHGLRLFITRDEVYQIVGESNTRAFTTEIPEVTGILIERNMDASNYGYDAWDAKGNGIKRRRNLWSSTSYSEVFSKLNPWLGKVMTSMSIVAPGKEIISAVSCYFFGEIFYKMRIDYEWGYSIEVSWEQFLEPSARAYGWRSLGPNESYHDVVSANDGVTSVIFMRTYHPDSDPMYGSTYVYSVIYQNNKIANDVENARGARFPTQKF